MNMIYAIKKEGFTTEVFPTEGFLEVGIESWPEWDSNPPPLSSVQTL